MENRCVGVWQNDRVEIIANDRVCPFRVLMVSYPKQYLRG